MRGENRGVPRTWVGREDELAAIGGRLERGQSVVVCGVAGVGKSTLLARATAEAGLRSVTCRCFRSLSRAAAAPLQLGFGEPIPVGDDLWTAQWVRRRLGRRVLLVEDLQWADELTLAVVQHLVTLVPTAVSVRSGDRGSEAASAAVAAADAIELTPLPTADAAELACRTHPQLRPQEALALARRCGGNPLLIEQLGRDDTARTLRSATIARLRRCGAGAWRDFAMLVRAGEPLPAHWLPGAETLAEAGLAVREGDVVRPRHALLAQALGEHLAEAANRAQVLEVDRRVADLAARDGLLSLAARSYGSAGDDGAAFACATASAAATSRPGERAEMLRLAAVHAAAEDAPGFAEDAVRELVGSGDYTAAAELIERLPDRTDAVWWSLVGRVRWQLGDDDGALDAFAAGLAAPEDDAAAAVVLRSEYARAVAITGGDQDTALALARRAVALAQEHDVELARAWGSLGTVEYFGDGPEHLEHMREALRRAEDPASSDVSVRLTLANNLASALESAGDTEGALVVARGAAAFADDLHMRGWSQQLGAMAVNVLMHRGDYGDVLVEAMSILDGPTQGRTAEQLEVSVGIALVDLGRLEEARARIDRALTVCADDTYGRGNLLWLAAEERIWSGQHREAARLAEESVAILAGPVRLFGILTAVHAQSGGGLPVVDYDLGGVDHPIVAPVPHEVAGLRARAAGEAGAREHFLRAAELWAGRHRRGELRCRWLAADTAAPDGPEGDAARVELLELETLLAEVSWLPMLGVVRRSLRSRGVRRAAPRGRSGELTLREREVLELIGQGLSNEAIAVRLGLSPATVAAQVASARARLGATTRWQAAGGP